MATDMENEIRELLRGRADGVRAPLEAPQPVLRRARRRRVATGAMSALVLAGIVAAAIVGTRALLAPDAAPDRIGFATDPTPNFAVWPQTTRADARAAQQCADQGDPECTWQLGINEVVRRYAMEKLGWSEVWFRAQGFNTRPVQLPEDPVEREVDIGLTDEVGPIEAWISECPPDVFERPCDDARITIARVLRPDVTGIWLITSETLGTYQQARAELAPPSPLPPAETPIPMPPMPQALKEFVDSFMQARLEGGGAERFLSEETLDLYDSRAGGLSLYGYTTAGGTTYEVSGWEREAGTGEIYRVFVRIHHLESQTTQHELLLVEHLPSARGWPHDHLVAYAERNE